MKSTWQKIYFNKQNIKAETAKAVLIRMPNNSTYSKYEFWHPKKLVRTEGGKGYFLSFSFTEQFEFNLTKKSKHGTVLNEVCLDSNEMLDAWNTINETLRAHSEMDGSYSLEVYEPNKIDGDVQIDESLLK